MIVITFSFLGNKVKIITEGDHCINKKHEEDSQLEEIQKIHNSILYKDEEKFKDAYKWCEIHCVGKFQKDRHMNFFL